MKSMGHNYLKFPEGKLKRLGTLLMIYLEIMAMFMREWRAR